MKPDTREAHPEVTGLRSMRGVVWVDGRLFATTMPPCAAIPRHNCVEFLDGECMLCVRDRLWKAVNTKE